MLTLFRRVMRSDDAATAIEYSLLAALIAVGILVALQNFGTALSDAFGRIQAHFAVIV